MANTTSSKTGTVVADVVTFNSKNCADGMTIYLKYNVGDGTSAALTFTVKNSKLSTDAYQYWDTSSLTVAAETYTLNATGNYRIGLPLALDEDTLIATVVYTGGTTQTLVVDAQFGG